MSNNFLLCIVRKKQSNFIFVTFVNRRFGVLFEYVSVDVVGFVRLVTGTAVGVCLLRFSSDSNNERGTPVKRSQ
jgi:hypothetical protein